MKHLIFRNAEGTYYNVCISHDYEVNTEYSKDLSKLLTSLHDVYNIFSSDFPPKLKNPLEKVREVTLEYNPNSHYIMTVEYTKPFTCGYKKLEEAYKQVLNGYSRKDAFFFNNTEIKLGCGTILRTEYDWYINLYLEEYERSINNND